jgi:hypothetical protein
MLVDVLNIIAETNKGERQENCQAWNPDRLLLDLLRLMSSATAVEITRTLISRAGYDSSDV